MIRIRDTLLPSNILLDIAASSREETIQKVAESLRSDLRISDWQEFLRALGKHEAAGKVNLQHGLTLPHVRTMSVTKMLMAFGRLTHPLEEATGPLQFVTLIGIPRAMDAEYLRLVGALMRVFRNEKLHQKLLGAQNPSEIVHLFEKGETEIEQD